MSPVDPILAEVVEGWGLLTDEVRPAIATIATAKLRVSAGPGMRAGRRRLIPKRSPLYHAASRTDANSIVDIRDFRALIAVEPNVPLDVGRRMGYVSATAVEGRPTVLSEFARDKVGHPPYRFFPANRSS